VNLPNSKKLLHQIVFFKRNIATLKKYNKIKRIGSDFFIANKTTLYDKRHLNSKLIR
jgi:hypothetical protein